MSDHLLWNKYGIKLHFPSCPFKVSIEGALSVLLMNDANYEFPVGFELVSAVYGIFTNEPLPKPVTVELQHCAPTCSKLCFLTADTQQVPPYVFSELSGGDFSSDTSYGKHQIPGSCRIALAKKQQLYLENSFQTYSAQVYFQKEHVSFVVVQNLAAHITVSEEYVCVLVRHMLLEISSCAGCQGGIQRISRQF